MGRTVFAAKIRSQETSKGRLEAASPRSVRIASVLLLNAALTHFYPHAGGRRRIAENLSSALQSAAVAPGDRRFLDVLRGFVGSLDDGHADVLHAGEQSRFRIPLEWSWVEGRLAITAAVPEIPEIRPGDVVLEVDGVAAERAVAEAEKRVSGATPGHRRYRALELLASGKEGQPKPLLVQRGEAPPFRVTVLCDAPAFGPSSARRQHPEKVAELAPGLLYVDLDRITDQDWTAALPRLEQAQGLVFDLRGYPASFSPLRVLGRLMDRPVTTCNAILLTTRPDQPAQPVTSCRTLEPESPRLKAPAVFLIDERAMSLAESLLQIVAENRLATLVGSSTAGTRGEINEMPLPGGYHVLWTGTLALNADGSAFWGEGFQPAVAVRPTLEGIRNGRDEVLEAGAAWLRNQPGPTHRPTPPSE